MQIGGVGGPFGQSRSKFRSQWPVLKSALEKGDIGRIHKVGHDYVLLSTAAAVLAPPANSPVSASAYATLVVFVENYLRTHGHCWIDRVGAVAGGSSEWRSFVDELLKHGRVGKIVLNKKGPRRPDWFLQLSEHSASVAAASSSSTATPNALPTATVSTTALQLGANSHARCERKQTHSALQRRQRNLRQRRRHQYEDRHKWHHQRQRWRQQHL